MLRDTERPSMTIQPGTLIGQYRVHSLLGEGGMGAVYYAEHIVLGRPAAIKVLLPHVARDAGLVQRFINEARVAAAMNHRNVVDVLDCGQFPSPDAPNAQWYIALEFLRGQSLGAFIAERVGQPIELTTILHILGEAANGLHAAHEKHNLVHRDVKPDNLFLIQTEDDPLRVKILDFGIAKLRLQESGVQTQSQTGMGTPAYAAPEQLRESKDVDRRADVWALGVIAYEMATGARPWGSTLSVWAIIAHHAAMTKAPDPREIRPDLSKKFAAVISKAMEPDRDRRWDSGKAFIRALADATPMPFSGTGMSILEKCAKELTIASNHSLTVGRPIPPELRLDAAAIATAPGRPSEVAHPLTVSSGVPRGPGTQPTGVVLGPISTIAGSSGQSFAGPTQQRRRSPLVYVAGVAGAIGIAGVVVFSLSRGSQSKGSEQDQRPAKAVDAGTGIVVDPAPAMSALAIMTTPDDAEIFVDGVSKGRAPINLHLAVGLEIEVRAEMEGHTPARESVRIAATPATVRLDLARLVDAGVPPPDAAPAVAPKDGGAGPRGGKPRPRGTGKGTGGDSDPGFDPNDVL